ncbi:hypothetical protein D9M71_569960 [compost metagenome]
MPPKPTTPKLGRKASPIMKAMPSNISATPAKLTGSNCRAYSASSRQMPPTTPPTVEPGFMNSNSRPYTPIMIRISATLGLVMTASTRVRQSGRCSTRLAPAVCS